MPSPSIAKLFFSFLRLGLTAFGGPAMIVYIKELSVKKNKWLDETRFKDGVVLCQSIPGATAMQMAAYVGLRLKGTAGALAAYVGFGLPAFGLMLLFSFLYDNYQDLPFIQPIFTGLQVIVVAIIAQATYSFGKNIAKSYQDLPGNIIVAVLSASFLGIGISPFLVILGAGLISLILFQNQEISGSPSEQRDGRGKVKQIVFG